MKTRTLAEPELAIDWPSSRVQKCLESSDRTGLITFLKTRYEERFFKPIHKLNTASGNYRGFGFPVMALCSLLIESLQCYRYGLPTTHDSE
jgi:hypothetical protein